MGDLHRLLRRQLKRHAGELPADTPLQPLLRVVSDTYTEADEGRRLMERSLDLTSEELLERNEQLSEQLALLNASLAASRTSSSDASGRPKRMFSIAERANIVVSCGTSAIRRRTASGSALAISIPSRRTVP